MLRRFLCAGAALVVAAFWMCVAAQAQGQDPVVVDEFRPVSPGELAQEQLPAAPLVFAAYAFVWLALVAYVFFLWRRLARVEHELREVSARLQAKSR